MKAVLLRLRGPLHVGKDSLDSADAVVHSDTLFGAVGSVLPRLGLDPDEFTAKVIESDFRISSAYPFFEDTYYLPKPVNADSLLREIIDRDKESYRVAKKFKKAKLLPKEVFEKVIAASIEPEELEKALPEGLPVKTVDLPKVALDRVTSNSSIYYLTQVVPEEGAGLYFLYDGDEKLFRDYLLPAVRYLGDEGLGGKRSWGLGLFDVEVRDFEIKQPEAGLYVTLSMVLQKSGNELAFWEPVKRSGWISNSVKPRRKPTMLFAREGSVVTTRGAGRIVDLDDYGNYSGEVGHKVHVYGRTFPVATRLGGDGQ
jgi:CRISPR-associated protein Csm4